LLTNTPSAETVGESAYRRIRADIIFGVLLPGQKLKLEKISEIYGTSISTLRELLNRMSSEGLIVVEGQRGFEVAPVPAQDFRQIAALRLLLENHAMAQSFEAGGHPSHRIEQTGPVRRATRCHSLCGMSLHRNAAAAAESLGAIGPASILVNNAGALRAGSLDTLSLSDWQANLTLNLTGYFSCAQAFGAQMLEKGASAIVHIASVSAHFPQNRSGACSAGKPAVAMLSEQLATEWGPRGALRGVS
jgi:NAD(P)-dependent dehydrogenase (short-subunit alcohol dehydrogenase family)